MLADGTGGGKTAEAIAGKIELENRLGRKVKTLIVCSNKQLRDLWEERIKGYITKERYEGKGKWEKFGPIKLRNIGIKDVKNGEDPKINGADTVIVDYHSLSFDLNKWKEVRKKIKDDLKKITSLISSSNKTDDEKTIDLKEAIANAVKKLKSQWKCFSRRKKLMKNLRDANFEYVILDEAHNAKNSDSSRYAHVQNIAKNTEYLALLTATPISIMTAIKDIILSVTPARKNAHITPVNVNGMENAMIKGALRDSNCDTITI